MLALYVGLLAAAHTHCILKKQLKLHFFKRDAETQVPLELLYSLLLPASRPGGAFLGGRGVRKPGAPPSCTDALWGSYFRGNPSSSRGLKTRPVTAVRGRL